MTTNIHRYSLLIFSHLLFSRFNYFKNSNFKRSFFFNQSFSCTPNAGLMLQQWLQVQRRQIFCPHPWRTVDSLKTVPRPYANHPNRSSCWPHSPGDKHKLCSCCCPSSHPQNHIQVNENHSLYELAAAVAGNFKGDVCCGCSSGSRSKACVGKCVGKCVWALLQQTGIVLGQPCQPAAH